MPRPRFTTTALALASTCLIAPWAMAQEQAGSPALNGSMLALSRSNGQLTIYNLATQESRDVGQAHTVRDQRLVGVEAAAYLPGQANVYAFWPNPTNSDTHLVHVSVLDALTHIVSEPLEGGKVGGATAVMMADGTKGLFAVQHEKTTPPVTIAGMMNINPNNSNQNEFTCHNGGTLTITRDHLHNNATVTPDGTFYQGPLTSVHVKPKGNGNQNSLVLDGKNVPIQNANTYDFIGDMEVRIFNDHMKNGKAMGHWWIQVISGTVVQDDVAVEAPNRLVRVDTETGVVTELMVTPKPMRGLATADGVKFVSRDEDGLWMLDTTTETRTLLTNIHVDGPLDCCFFENKLYRYVHGSNALLEINQNETGQVSSASYVAHTPELSDAIPTMFDFNTTPDTLTKIGALYD